MDTSTSIDLGHVSKETGLPQGKIERTAALLDEGNTVPFITRYRKDQTGGLDEEQIRSIQETLSKLRLLAERKSTILKSIEAQGKLTPDLAAQIEAAYSTKRLEDLYLPYKPKKQTLASVARQRGLEPLAREIVEGQSTDVELAVRATEFVRVDKELFSVDDVMQGVQHIIAERFAERSELRGKLRKILWRTGKLVSRSVAPMEPPAKPQADQVAKPNANPAPTSASEQPVPPAVTEAAETTPQPAVAEATSQESSAQPASPTPENAPTSQPTEVQQPTATDKPTPTAETQPDDGAAKSTDGEQASAAAEPAADAPRDAATTPAEPQINADVPKTAAAVAKPAVAKNKARKNKKKQKDDDAFKDYYDFQESISKIPHHRVLAINRGERAKILRVKIEADAGQIESESEKLLLGDDHPHADFLRTCVRNALTRLILPSLEREIRRELTERAENHAVNVFARNLRSLLLQPPVRTRRVLAIDPGFRSGCKYTALDEFGNVLGHGVFHIIGKEERRQQGRAELVESIKKHRVSVLAIGNGTAGRETEQLAADILANELKDTDVAYVIVNEAGASVYSTSPAGREELPDYDAVIRSAISIGRRLLDPLSELVKINPANIGVGLYQHDVKAKHLQDSLDAVVESCVNYVGVDVNTASPALLRYVSGLNQLTARRLYEHRREHGPFRSRMQLKEVAGFGDATFVQAAGFLKINSGDNPLDATWIHPESYDVAQRVLDKLGKSIENLAVPAAPPQQPTADAAEPETNEISTDAPATGAAATKAPVIAAPATRQPATKPQKELAEQLAKIETPALANELEVGELLLSDIVSSLARPGRDPRDDLPAPIFRRGIMKLEDLEPGMELTGTVLNVVDFGAFVDIGLSDSGLVHISRLADRFVDDPHQVVSVGDILKVWVVEVDKDRRRVSLTAVKPGTEKPQPARHEKAGQNRSGKPVGEQRAARPPRRGDKPQGGRRPKYTKHQTSQRPQRKPKPKPVTPITKEMEEGKAPMRSFSDLAQFFNKKKDDGSADGKAKT